MDPSTYIYALFHEPSKCFVLNSGYYGNETNIKAFKSRKDGESHIEMYYPRQGYTLKRMKVK